jgi:beta-mannosidase
MSNVVMYLDRIRMRQCSAMLDIELSQIALASTTPGKFCLSVAHDLTTSLCTMALTLKLSLLYLLVHSSAGKQVLDLTTHPWTLSNDALSISVPAHLPSQAHLDLFAAGVIGDPYHDLNDFNLRWVALNNWTYSSGPIGELSSLTGKANGNSSTTTSWLLFDGLDTFASIELCGRHVASTNNQFRQWWFDVSAIVDDACADEDGGAVLSMNFGSAPKIANKIAEEPGAETWPYYV